MIQLEFWPNRNKQEPQEDLSFLGNYLNIHLEDLESGFEHWDCPVASEDACAMVGSFCRDIEVFMSGLLEGDEPLYFFKEHPTETFSRFLKEKRESLRFEEEVMDYGHAVLEYAYKRCLYAYVAFGLGLPAPPKSEREITKFEREYLQEGFEVKIKGFGVGFLIVCEVEPVLAGGITTFARKWLIELCPDD